jgi:hypothetical protein
LIDINPVIKNRSDLWHKKSLPRHREGFFALLLALGANLQPVNPHSPGGGRRV